MSSNRTNILDELDSALSEHWKKGKADARHGRPIPAQYKLGGAASDKARSEYRDGRRAGRELKRKVS